MLCIYWTTTPKKVHTNVSTWRSNTLFKREADPRYTAPVENIEQVTKHGGLLNCAVHRSTRCFTCRQTEHRPWFRYEQKPRIRGAGKKIRTIKSKVSHSINTKVNLPHAPRNDDTLYIDFCISSEGLIDLIPTHANVIWSQDEMRLSFNR